jgi:hypothetical protein
MAAFSRRREIMEIQSVPLGRGGFAGFAEIEVS